MPITGFVIVHIIGRCDKDGGPFDSLRWFDKLTTACSGQVEDALRRAALAHFDRLSASRASRGRRIDEQRTTHDEIQATNPP